MRKAAKRTTRTASNITRVNISFQVDIYKQAKEKSKNTGVPISFVAQRALEQWVQGRFDPSAG